MNIVTNQAVRTISRKDRNRNLKWFLAGFVEGEGSFNVSLRKKIDYKTGWQVVLSFNVSQKDVKILELLHDTIGCGIIKVRKYDGLHSLDVTNTQEIIQKVIPFFREYRLFSVEKRKNFAIFCKITQLMSKNKHKDEQGLRKILNLREKLNEGKGRKRKYQFSDVFPIAKSSETIRQAPVPFGTG